MATTSRRPSHDAPYDLISAGESMIMFVPDPAGPVTEHSRYRPTVAGAESNVACFATAFGLRSAWVSRVGSDPFGDFVVTHLQRAGVDVSLVERDAERATGVAFKELSETGTRVSYFRSGSAASALTERHADALLSTPARLVHLSGITPALSESSADFVRRLCVPRTANARLSFDVNWRPSLWDDRSPQVLLEACRASDIVFVGLDEAEALWGCTTASEVRRLLSASEVLVVKHGPEGATGFDGDRETFVSALGVDVVEPVGAGDAFAAGFLAGTHREMSMRERLRLGTIAAAAALRVASDVGPLPCAEDIDALLGLDEAEWRRSKVGQAQGTVGA